MEWRQQPWTRTARAMRVVMLLGAMSLAAAQAKAQAPPDTSAIPDSAATPAPVENPTFRAWSPGRQWITLRAGYAKSALENAADGNVGAGFGFSRIGKSLWSLGVSAHFDLLGRFGSAAEIEVPMTFEIARHYGWNTGIRPYLGVGGGAFFYKTYRTGDDVAEVRPGFLLLGGMNAPVAENTLVGFDIRVAFQGAAGTRNPVFASKDEDVAHWSVKLTYSRVD